MTSIFQPPSFFGEQTNFVFLFLNSLCSLFSLFYSHLPFILCLLSSSIWIFSFSFPCMVIFDSAFSSLYSYFTLFDSVVSSFFSYSVLIFVSSYSSFLPSYTHFFHLFPLVSCSDCPLVLTTDGRWIYLYIYYTQKVENLRYVTSFIIFCSFLVHFL